jgi:excisionase family DNA binding protein
MNATITPEFLRPDQAAQLLSVSKRTLSAWQKARIVPFVKIGRKCVLFRRSDLDKAMTRFSVRALGEG